MVAAGELADDASDAKETQWMAQLKAATSRAVLLKIEADWWKSLTASQNHVRRGQGGED